MMAFTVVSSGNVSDASVVDRQMDLKAEITEVADQEVSGDERCSTSRPPAGLISNPLSFYNQRRPAPVLRNILKDYPEVHKYPASTRAEIREAVRALHAIDARLVIANGGDGTVQGVFTEVWRQWRGEQMPLLAVMPGGRTNVISKDLNAKLRPRDILRGILANYCAGDENRRKQRSLLRIDIDDHRKETELGFLISAAGLAGGIEECWDFRHRNRKLGMFGGLGTAAWVIGRLFSTPAGTPILKSRQASITVDGERIPGDHQQIVMVTTNHRLPMLVNPFWQQREESQGELKITVVRSKTRGLWWRSIPLAFGWGGTLPESAGFYSRSASHIRMELEQSFHLDGESWKLEYPQQVDVRPGPRLEFITA